VSRALALGLALATSAATAAEEKQAPEKPVQAYGEDHPACLEWTDGCLVCARQEDGSSACSMVGVACLPAAAVCLKSK